MGQYSSLVPFRGNDTVPFGAVRLHPEAGILSSYNLGIICSLPAVAVMSVAALLRLSGAGRLPSPGDGLLISAAVTLIAAALLEAAHELVHAAFYPRTAAVEIWRMERTGRRFVYCEQPISRGRYIIMSLAPFLLLSVIPFLVWCLLAGMMSSDTAIFPAVLFIYMAAGSGGDLGNVFRVLRQVPPGGKIFSWGLGTYWFSETEERDGF